MGACMSDDKGAAMKMQTKKDRAELKQDKKELEDNYQARMNERRSSKASIEQQWTANRTGKNSSTAAAPGWFASYWGATPAPAPAAATERPVRKSSLAQMKVSVRGPCIFLRDARTRDARTCLIA